MIKQSILLVAVALLVLSGCVTTPDDLHGDDEYQIGPESLSEEFDQYKVLDVRSVEEYAEGHIDSAMVIPLDEISQSGLDALGFAKSDDIVVYANSATRADKARVFLDAMGYSSVKVLSGGLVHWVEDGFEVVVGAPDEPVDKPAPLVISSLEVFPSELDLGLVPRSGGVVSRTFELVNTGSAVVQITDVSTSCGCTSAELSSDSIAPGEHSSFEVIFDPDFHKEPMGRFTRTVFMETSEGVELQAKIHVRISEE